MKKIFLLLLYCISLLLSCGDNSKNTVPSGKKIFKTYCMSCHGLNGALEFNGAKNLNESILPKADRIILIKYGRNLMMPFENILSEEEIQAVVEYSMKYGKEDR